MGKARRPKPRSAAAAEASRSSSSGYVVGAATALAAVAATALAAKQDSYDLAVLLDALLPTQSPSQTKSSAAAAEVRIDGTELFEDLVSDPMIRAAFMRKPLHLPGRAPQLANSFTLEKDVLPMATRGVLDGRAVPVLSARESNGTTWNGQNERIRDAAHLRERLRAATLYMNQAGAAFPQLAELCTDAQRAFGIPANINVYLAAGGDKRKFQSAPSGGGEGGATVPLHSDKQDVFVLQTQGQKRWRVYEPPPHAAIPPGVTWVYNRGKEGNVIKAEECANGGHPVLDVVLKAGDVLFIPSMWPHVTEATDPPATSTHLTLGLESHNFGFDFLFLNNCVRLRRSLPSVVPHLGKLTDEEWRMLMLTPAYGFAAGGGVGDGTPNDEGALRAWRERFVCALLKIGGGFGAAGIQADAPCDSDAVAVQTGTREVVAYFAAYFTEMMRLKAARHVPLEVRSTPEWERGARAKHLIEMEATRRRQMEAWCTEFVKR